MTTKHIPISTFDLFHLVSEALDSWRGESPKMIPFGVCPYPCPEPNAVKVGDTIYLEDRTMEPTTEAGKKLKAEMFPGYASL